MSTQEQAAVTQSADSKDGHGTATAKSSLIMDPAVTSTSPSDEQQLHKLTAAEFQEYNRLARHMDAFVSKVSFYVHAKVFFFFFFVNYDWLS